MSRHISNWVFGLAFSGVIALTAEPVFPWEVLQESDQLANCWQDLAAEDSALAYRACGQLVQNQAAAVKLLGKQMKAAEGPDLAQIRTWLNELSSPTFGVRERAFKGLRAQEELAEPFLRKVLEAAPDLETRRRVESLLSALDQPIVAPEKIRQLRAIETLEMMVSPEAKQVLQKLAKGYAGHRQTKQAQESLARLSQRAPISERWLAWTKDPPAAAGGEEPLPFGARTRLGTTLFRHQGSGRHVTLSSDGRLAFSDDGSAVYVRDAQTWKLQRKIEAAVTGFAVAPRGTLLALGDNGALAYWDWQAGKEFNRLELPAGVKLRRMAFSPDGTKVVFQCFDDSLRTWEPTSGQERTLWQPTEAKQKLHAFSPDGNLIVAGVKGASEVFDLQKNKKNRLPDLDREPRLVFFSPDAKYVVLASDYSGERLHICDAATGKMIWRSGEGIGAYVNSVRFSADGRFMAVGSYQHDLSLWEVQTGKFMKSLAGSHNRSVAAISADGRWLAGAGQTMRLWNLETDHRMDEGEGHRVNIEGLSFSQRSDCIVTFDEREVRLWDSVTGKQKCRLDTDGHFLRGAAISPDGQLIAAAHPGPGEGFLKVWEASTGREKYSFPSHSQRQYGRYADVHFSADGSFLFSWGDDSYLRKWDMRTGRALLEVVTPGQALEDDFSEVHHAWVQNRFLLLDSDGDLHAIDLDTGKEAPVVKVGPVTEFGGATAFSPNGRHFASAGRDSNLSVRNTTSGKSVLAVALPGLPRALVFSPDGRTLGAAVEDKILIVEVATGKVRMTLEAGTQALAFSADGRFLATALNDTTAVLWDLALLSETRKK